MYIHEHKDGDSANVDQVVCEMIRDWRMTWTVVERPASVLVRRG